MNILRRVIAAAYGEFSPSIKPPKIHLNKYRPHQGEQEKARRLKQAVKG